MSARLTNRPAAALLAVLLLAGCEFDERAIGVGRAQPVVHGVLDPAKLDAVILVEELLTGRVRVDEGTPDADDPIVSGGGIPISGARVVVTAATGDSAVAVEVIGTRSDGKGAGVYRIRNGASPQPTERDWLVLLPGRTYALRVDTPDGATVRGATTIPSSTPARVNPSLTPFNRDRDSLFLQWGEVPLAHRYALRVDSPRGPFVVFVDSLEYLVAGDLRNIFSEGVPSTFVPGFRQTVTVGAVDQNYYDYFRSRNSLFTGRGLINHLQGGIGLFGSYVMLRGVTLNVTATVDDPLEAPYQRFGGTPGIAPRGLVLYVESASSRALRQVSGSWLADGSAEPRGLIGTLDSNNRLTLAMLRGQFADDTVDVLDLAWDGLALLGSMRETGVLVDYRRAAP